MGGKTNRRRHHKAIVVVGVFANQVYAAGCAEDSWPIAEARSKALAEFAQIHRSSPGCIILNRGTASAGVITPEFPCRTDP